MSSSSPLVSVSGLCRRFGQVKAVDGLDFQIEAGTCVGLIGANGAGKTTLMRMLVTLDLPDAGQMMIRGVDALAYPDQVRRFIGWMPDAMDMWKNTTVDDYLSFVARVNGFKGANRREVIDYWVAFCQLEPLRKRKIDKLSKGESQRLALARMLLGDPQLLVMDEPAAGLDPKARAIFKDLVHELQRQGRTLIISSHILSELSEMCQSLIMMDQGRLLYSGSSDAFLARVRSGEGRLLRLRPLHELDDLMQFLLARPEQWLQPCVFEPVVEVRFLGSDAELAAALTDLVQVQPLLDFHHEELSLEKSFIELLEHQTTSTTLSSTSNLS